ncbi:MAG: hypothetical protein ABL894_14370 [Hyphomicrobium sp.]
MIRSQLTATACAAMACVFTLAASAQQPPMAKGDPREGVSLSAAEVETLLTGMRTYLESIQGIVAAMAENEMARIPDFAAKSGAKLLHGTTPLTGLKVPLGFSSMAFDTHDKFDKLAAKAKRGTSRGEVLTDLRDIMGNCISCHAAYRLAK